VGYDEQNSQHELPWPERRKKRGSSLHQKFWFCARINKKLRERIWIFRLALHAIRAWIRLVLATRVHGDKLVWGMAGENGREDGWLLIDLRVEGVKQEGPTCGLVALHMACMNLFHESKGVGSMSEETTCSCSHSDCKSLSSDRPTVKDLLGKHSLHTSHRLLLMHSRLVFDPPSNIISVNLSFTAPSCVDTRHYEITPCLSRAGRAQQLGFTKHGEVLHEAKHFA
jgi:hypothetical protein